MSSSRTCWQPSQLSMGVCVCVCGKLLDVCGYIVLASRQSEAVVSAVV